MNFVSFFILCKISAKYSLLPHIFIPFNSHPKYGFLTNFRCRYDIWVFHGGRHSCCCIVDYNKWFSVASGFRSFGRRYCLSLRTQLICYPATSTPTVQKLTDTQYEVGGLNLSYLNIIHKPGIIVGYWIFPFNVKQRWKTIFTHIPYIMILSNFYSPTDTQLNCLKSNFKIYIKIDIKTAPTCFGVITIIRERIICSC
jgi:hypothetical protein